MNFEKSKRKMREKKEKSYPRDQERPKPSEVNETLNFVIPLASLPVVARHKKKPTFPPFVGGGNIAD